MKPEITVLISVYNQPQWLQKSLWGYECQTYRNFEIIIADDGSGTQTLNFINDYRSKSVFPIAHIWQQDKGFRKNKILNQALSVAASEYIIVTDGDCIPRADFIEKHIALRKRGYFLSGGYFKLPDDISQSITEGDIKSQVCFDNKWLISKGLKKSFRMNKLTSKGLKEKLLNTLTTTKATWDGNNASAWKSDILAINGYDERMGYGGEDRELGERLMNFGIKGRQVRYSAICLHLEHPRDYRDESMLKFNNEIRRKTKKSADYYTDHGIVQTNNS